MPTEDQLTVLGRAPGAFTLFSWKNLTFVAWSGQATIASVKVLNDLTLVSRKRHPEGLSSVHIVRANTPFPDSATREGLLRITAENGDWLAGVAVVIGGSGFWASTMRSVVTALRVLAPRTFEMRIHGSIHEAVEWMPATHLKRTGVVIERDALLRVLQRVEQPEASELGTANPT